MTMCDNVGHMPISDPYVTNTIWDISATMVLNQECNKKTKKGQWTEKDEKYEQKRQVRNKWGKNFEKAPGLNPGKYLAMIH